MSTAQPPAAAALSPKQPVHCQRIRIPDGGTAAFPDQGQVEICVIIDGAAIHHGAVTGSTAVSGAGEARRISPGTVIIAGPGRGHSFEQPRDLTLYAVSFLAEWLMDDLRASWSEPGLLPPFWMAILFRRGRSSRLPRFSVTPEAMRPLSRELEDLAAAAAAEPNPQPNPQRLYLKSTLLKLMALLSAAYAREPIPEDDTAEFSLPVTRVLDDIEQSLADGQPFRVADAAYSAAMTSDHLCRLFREATGESPRTYYQRRRIQVAAGLLLDPANSIAGIAAQLGYCDAAHFCNAFKRLHGQSPREYRKHHHGG